MYTNESLTLAFKEPLELETAQIDPSSVFDWDIQLHLLLAFLTQQTKTK